MRKAKHYHDRHIRGKSENETSVVRQTAIQIIIADRDNTFDEEMGNNFERIPSPSGFCTKDNNLQISLLPNFTEAQSFEIDLKRG